MDMSGLATIIKSLLQPPAILFLIILAGLLLHKLRFGLPLASIGLFVLILLSCPAFSIFIADALENRYPMVTPDDIQRFQPQAIVVIGGGAAAGDEFQQSPTVNAPTLLRLRYAAKLARETRLPVLVAGGKPLRTDRAEAQEMAEVLQNEFGVPVAWQEAESRTTLENATLSHKLLQPLGISRIILVTQAYHIPRAVWCFRDAGFEVLAAPTAFISHRFRHLPEMDFIPSARALTDSFLVLHEYVGLLWYRLGGGA